MTNPILEISTLRVCICGGRKFDDTKYFAEFMEWVFAPRVTLDNVTIVQGGATGADWLAKEWADIRKVNCQTYKAKWVRYGKRAGSVRNQEMLDSGLDFLIAFPGGTGTAHMMKICEEAGVPILTEENIDDYLTLPTK